MNVLRGAIVAACLLAWPGAAAAQRSLVIQQFAADVEVGTGGAITCHRNDSAPVHRHVERDLPDDSRRVSHAPGVHTTSFGWTSSP